MTAASERDFAALVWRHQNALYRYGRGLGLDHDTALDLVQDAFVKAHARLDQCREPDKARSWLFRIFRNTMLDWARNVRRTEVPLLDVEEPAGEEDFAERHALREAIGAALASLPPILREAFLLRHELGHSYEEIAELAGVSLSAAKMRVARAHAALRETLEPDFGDVTGAGSRSS
ncbi:MAG TPA: RNA polymerase sigma factor [Gemmatimonadales bacterium]